MSSEGKANDSSNKQLPEGALVPNCLAISERGIRTAQDFSQFMSAMMGDVIAGRLSHTKASTATRSGMAMLKVIEMQHRYGDETGGKKSLNLID